MFGARKRRIKELEHEVDTLNECMKRTHEANEYLRKQIGEYQDVLREQNEYTCDQLFDFANPSISVFSIERQMKDKKWVTNIGYLIVGEKNDEDKVVHEWWMSTSRSQHQKLVNEYKKSKGIE